MVQHSGRLGLEKQGPEVLACLGNIAGPSLNKLTT